METTKSIEELDVVEAAAFLARLQSLEEKQKERMNMIIEAAKKCEEYQYTAQAHEAVSEHIKAIKARIEELALQYFQDVNAKSVCPGVGIRETRTFEYDPKQAVEYCLEHKLPFVTVDAKPFEAYAKAMFESKSTDGLPVKQVVKTTVTISQTMAKYYPVDEEVES